MSFVLVSAEARVLEPDSPILHADDRGIVHGDGLFETMLVRDGRVCGLDRHLDRLARSAPIAGLAVPDRAQLIAMVDAGLSRWRESYDGEGMLRLVVTKGREHDPRAEPTRYLTIAPVPERVAAARRDGVRAVTLPTAYEPGLAARAPWLLADVKSLSYAVNMAALRHVREIGVDDAIFVSTTGTVLEGPRGSVVAVIDGGLVTPMRDDGVLPGTTQAALFDLAAREGIKTSERVLTVPELYAADEVWLVSSVTLAARVRQLDGRELDCRNVIGVADWVRRSAGS
ncbi:aminodeoxychorismate lyase [Gordonia neofelifaecis]|uniref:4-amino-4-deoxychorismate lyase n=1 Tax=Gordonia neofelifaecis NRRL B-59395 TaxID=644548 RepID=F1YN58_9ACTN|nr:aminodeoxychorismate lyase [Gordonia neofelifaecis]EGD53863.1 4-amino-4-deoxychorismate lyase [Gordonia neofelifaecis NRRL B-59395]